MENQSLQKLNEQDVSKDRHAKRTKATSCAYVLAVTTNLVERLGDSFITPVLVPYGQVLGASTETIALFTFLRGLGTLLSVFWLPTMSDWMGKTKPLLCIALAMTSISYAVQASTVFFKVTAPGVAIIMICCGRFTAGFFSGTQPVLRAHISEISNFDPNLLKSRLVASSLASQLMGVVMAPIAGCLATVALQVPFYVMTGITLMVFFAVCMLYRESSEVNKAAGVEEESAAGSKGSADVAGSHRHPMLDPPLWLTFFAGVTGISVIPSFAFLVPLQLMQPKFGLAERFPDPEQFQEHIAQTTGLIMMPNGLFAIFSAAVLYMALTKRYGEVKVLSVVSVLNIPAWASFGFASQLWHMYFAAAAGGLMMGFIIPVFSPLVARYSAVVHPHNQATAQSMPLFGFYIAQMCAQQILALILGCFEDRDMGLKVCWFIVSILVFTCVVLMAYFGTIVDRVAPMPKDKAKVDSPANTGTPRMIARHLSTNSVASLGEVSTPMRRLSLKANLSKADMGTSLQPKVSGT